MGAGDAGVREEELRGANDQLSAAAFRISRQRGWGSTLLIGSKRTNQRTEFYHAPKYQKYSENVQLQGSKLTAK
jgi:hypothetical protein